MIEKDKEHTANRHHQETAEDGEKCAGVLLDTIWSCCTLEKESSPMTNMNIRPKVNKSPSGGTFLKEGAMIDSTVKNEDMIGKHASCEWIETDLFIHNTCFHQ